mgnify:CR=1 FL=1
MTAEPTGRVIAVRGAVVDVAFDGPLPRIEDALTILWDRPEPLVVEVANHLDETSVRTVALAATGGLRRGTPVLASGGPLTVAVGEAVLGRLLDVSGTVRDGGPPLPADLPRAPIHRAPPPLSARSAASEMSSPCWFLRVKSGACWPISIVMTRA